jgi:hypothetical protein
VFSLKLWTPFSFSENKDLQLNPIVMLPKIVHMQLAITGCDDILAILMIIWSISRLLAVKRLQTNCQVIDVNSVETNSCTKVCSLWIYCAPYSSQQTLQNHQPTGYSILSRCQAHTPSMWCNCVLQVLQPCKIQIHMLGFNISLLHGLQGWD